MSVYVNNKNLQVTIKNNDYAKDTTLQSIVDKLTTSPSNPLSVAIVNTDGMASNATLLLTNDKLDLLNTSVSTVINASGLTINHPSAFGDLFSWSALTAGDASLAVEPVGTTNTIFGRCNSLGDGVASVNLTVQLSNDNTIWVNSTNTLNLNANDPIELTFWSSAKLFRVTVDQACNLSVHYGSK